MEFNTEEKCCSLRQSALNCAFSYKPVAGKRDIHGVSCSSTSCPKMRVPARSCICRRSVSLQMVRVTALGIEALSENIRHWKYMGKPHLVSCRLPKDFLVGCQCNVTLSQAYTRVHGAGFTLVILGTSFYRPVLSPSDGSHYQELPLPN